jgi:calcium/calmodulin-dependent protein kinase I
VRAHELFEEAGHFYFVLEKVSGGELFDRIVAKTYYNEKEARKLAEVRTNAYIYIHIHTYTHTYIHTHISNHIHTHTYIYTHIYTLIG